MYDPLPNHGQKHTILSQTKAKLHDPLPDHGQTKAKTYDPLPNHGRVEGSYANSGQWPETMNQIISAGGLALFLHKLD